MMMLLHFLRLRPTKDKQTNENHLDSKRFDLQDIREHLNANESPTFVKKVTQEILAEVNTLKEWKNKGTFVPELEDLHLTTHRQLLAGQNRIIIERGHDDNVYVHMIAHTSRDLEALIRRRLLNS
jgi:plasmid stabilization system protein ParE